MQTIDGRKDAKLHPASGKFIITVASHMSTNVVTPPTVTHIGSAGGEIGLEVKGFPRNNCITGKTNGIAMTPRACVAREKQRPFSVSGNVQNVQMVQHPQRIHPFPGILILTGLIGLVDPPVIRSLLPVHPPKIHAVLLIGMVQHIKIVCHKLFGENIKRNTLAAFGIYATFFCH